MRVLFEREIVVGGQRYSVIVYRLPGRSRVRAEASQDGRAIESIDAAGQLAARQGIRRRLARMQGRGKS